VDKYRVLIVDDKKNDAKEYKEMVNKISGGKYDVIIAQNTKETRNKLDSSFGDFDIILIDHKLGNGEDGIKFCEEIHKIYPFIPIIVYTLYPHHKETKERAYKAGAVRFIGAPEGRDEMELILKVILGDFSESIYAGYNSIIDSVENEISIIDKDYRILFANKKRKEIHGSELLGKTCSNVYPWLSEEEVEIIIKLIEEKKYSEIDELIEKRTPESCGKHCSCFEVFDSGRTTRREGLAVYSRTKKKIYYLSETASPIFDKNGNVRMVINDVRDITKQVKTSKIIESLSRCTDPDKVITILMDGIIDMGYKRARYYNCYPNLKSKKPPKPHVDTLIGVICRGMGEWDEKFEGYKLEVPPERNPVLFPSSLFSMGEILDWRTFLRSLKEHADSTTKRTWDFLETDTKRIIINMNLQRKSSITENVKMAIINGLNNILRNDDFHDKNTFVNIKLSEEGKKLLENGLEKLSEVDLLKFNRLLLESAYPHKIEKSKIEEPVIREIKPEEVEPDWNDKYPWIWDFDLIGVERMDVPIIVGNRIIGMIYIDNGRDPEEDEELVEEDKFYMSTLARYAGQALENAKNVKRLEDLNRIGSEITAKMASGGIYDYIVKEICETLKVRMCSLYMVDQEYSKLLRVANYIEDGIKKAEFNDDYEIKTKDPDKLSVTGRVFNEGKSKIIDNVALEDEASRINVDKYEECFPENEKIGTALFVPLKYVEEKIGVIRLVNRTKKSKITFTDEDKEFVEILGDQMALVLLDRMNQIRFDQLKFSSLGMLAGNIAHEMRTPVENIAFNTEILLEKINSIKVPDRINKLLKSIHNSINTIHDIITSMLGYTKKSGGEKVVCSPANIIDNVLSLIRHSFKERGVDIIKNPFDLDCRIKADRIIIQQVLMNVLRNSLESFDAIDVDRPKELILSVYEKDNICYIGIQDTGCGIEKKYFEKIFRPYFTTKKKGTGTGLYLSKLYINEMGGKITIESKPGKGTNVSIFFPIECKEEL